MNTPTQQLTTKIIERLIEEKLLSPEDGQALSTKLAEGKLRSEDWRLPLELSMDREGKR